jgi:hypothetical protein
MKKSSIPLAILSAASTLCAQAATAQAPSPPNGLGSNHNYTLSSCQPIRGLSVTVAVNQDVVGPKGLGVQLNANSPPRASTLSRQGPPATFQQIMMGIGVEPFFNWDIQNFAPKGQLLSKGDRHFVKMPDVTWPAGYTLKITVNNNDAGDVTGATFLVKYHGAKVKEWTEVLTTIPGITGKYLAPIYGFQLNLVGPTGGQVLSAGAGTITYSASTPMKVTPTRPSCLGPGNTAEKANTVYGELPAGPRTSFVQTFEVACGPGEARLSAGGLCVGPGGPMMRR